MRKLLIKSINPFSIKTSLFYDILKAVNEF